MMYQCSKKLVKYKEYTVVLIILTFWHIQCLHLMYAEVAWVLVSSETQVQPQIILDPDYLPDYLSNSYDYCIYKNFSKFLTPLLTYRHRDTKALQRKEAQFNMVKTGLQQTICKRYSIKNAERRSTKKRESLEIYLTRTP